jgi:hypothetical protein
MDSVVMWMLSQREVTTVSRGIPHLRECVDAGASVKWA